MNNIENVISVMPHSQTRDVVGAGASCQLVETGYFRERRDRFEEKYRDKFPLGWGQFFGEYSKGTTDKNNLEFDEWAFLCEHFMREDLTPPGETVESVERPETISGFSFGDDHCRLTLTSTTQGYSEWLLTATHGRMQMVLISSEKMMLREDGRF